MRFLKLFEIGDSRPALDIEYQDVGYRQALYYLRIAGRRYRVEIQADVKNIADGGWPTYDSVRIDFEAEDVENARYLKKGMTGDFKAPTVVGSMIEVFRHWLKAQRQAMKDLEVEGPLWIKKLVIEGDGADEGDERRVRIYDRFLQRELERMGLSPSSQTRVPKGFEYTFDQADFAG